jgi:hypothetical protein
LADSSTPPARRSIIAAVPQGVYQIGKDGIVVYLPFIKLFGGRIPGRADLDKPVIEVPVTLQ